MRGVLNPRDRFLQVRQRIRIAEPDVAVAVVAEGPAVQARYAGIVQQNIGQLLRADSRLFDIGERIEGAARECAMKTGDTVQTLANRVAPAPELGDHLLDAVLRTGQRGDSGALRKAR